MKLVEDEQNSKLRKKRKEREQGLTPKARAQCPCESKVFVVLEDEGGEYHCHRYTQNPLTGEFFFSKDVEAVDIDGVFNWLNFTSNCFKPNEN